MSCHRRAYLPGCSVIGLPPFAGRGHPTSRPIHAPYRANPVARRDRDRFGECRSNHIRTARMRSSRSCWHRNRPGTWSRSTSRDAARRFRVRNRDIGRSPCRLHMCPRRMACMPRTQARTSTSRLDTRCKHPARRYRCRNPLDRRCIRRRRGRMNTSQPDTRYTRRSQWSRYNDRRRRECIRLRRPPNTSQPHRSNMSSSPRCRCNSLQRREYIARRWVPRKRSPAGTRCRRRSRRHCRYPPRTACIRWTRPPKTFQRDIGRRWHSPPDRYRCPRRRSYIRWPRAHSNTTPRHTGRRGLSNRGRSRCRAGRGCIRWPLAPNRYRDRIGNKRPAPDRGCTYPPRRGYIPWLLGSARMSRWGTRRT